MRRIVCAIYARVSSKDQWCEMQLTDLRAYAKRMDWDVIEYIEKASAKGGGKRPVLEQLFADAQARKFSLVLVWKMDRFGRSLQDFIANQQTLDVAGSRLVIPSQGLDTDDRSPMGKLTRHLLMMLAEFERDLIAERSQAGLTEYQRAYAAGEVGESRHSKSKMDLPVGRPRAVFDRERAREMRAGGASYRVIAKALGVGVGTIHSAIP